MTWDSVGDLNPDVRHPMSEGAWEPQARRRDVGFALAELRRVAGVRCFRGAFIRPCS